jgi:cell division protein ZipA
MSSELRWILLVIGVLFIVGLALWERRRPRQANNAPERAAAREVLGHTSPRPPRDASLVLPEMRARDPLTAPGQELPMVDLTGDPERVPVLEARARPQSSDAEATAEAEGADEAEEAEEAAQGAAESERPDPLAAGDAVAESLASPAAQGAAEDFADAPKTAPAPPAATLRPPGAPPGAPVAAREVLPELPAAAAPVVEWPPDEERRIVALRLVAPQPQRFPGRSLRQALAAEGFVLGRFAIFHKPDEARRAVLSAASLNRPGTFDVDTMDSQHYGGLSLFAVLPGPKPPPQAFDELVFTARSLNERLQGVLQDEQGGPLTPSRIATLRERLNSGAAL